MACGFNSGTMQQEMWIKVCTSTSANNSIKSMSHGERALKDLFPDLFLLSLVKDAIVASYIERMGEGGAHHWNPTFMHAIQDWALESVACCKLIFLWVMERIKLCWRSS
jgi:hypothetical protein